MTELKEGGEGKGGSVKVLTFGNIFFWRAPLTGLVFQLNFKEISQNNVQNSVLNLVIEKGNEK